MYDQAGFAYNQGNSGSGTSLISSTNFFVISPNHNAITARAWACTVQIDCAGIAPILNLFWRPTVGSDTGRILISSLTQSLANWIRGNQIYAEFTRLVKPGEELLGVIGTGTGTAGFGMAGVWFEPAWGVEGNVQTQKRIFTF